MKIYNSSHAIQKIINFKMFKKDFKFLLRYRKPNR